MLAVTFNYYEYATAHKSTMNVGTLLDPRACVRVELYFRAAFCS